MVDEKPLQHQLHDLAHEVMDEIGDANQHLEHAYEALLTFIEQVADQQPEWADILLQKSGKLQAAADILVATAEEVHNPETWKLPAFGDEPNIGRA
jgi:ABC-type transporter Mla subunit MlaD